jgi:exonuclease SbcD
MTTGANSRSAIPGQPSQIRVLLIADTHLGFDLPLHPRVERRRRGEDFFTNYERALTPAYGGEVDLVVHGGDLFFRSRVPASIVEMAMAPLVRVAELGLPVFIVPGNHERSRIPLHLWSAHPNIYIFDAPSTFSITVRGVTVGLSGFPFIRNIRDVFDARIEETRHRDRHTDIQLLCLHQTVEGAKVGPSDYTFRRGPDVIRGSDIPAEFDAVLCGHIHRAQMLTRDLSNRPLPAPVIYAGSIERTSFAERDERKSYSICSFSTALRRGQRMVDASFVALPARPMIHLDIERPDPAGRSLTKQLEQHIRRLDPDAVVRIQVNGPLSPTDEQVLSAANLRSLAPDTMNVSLARTRPSQD